LRVQFGSESFFPELQSSATIIGSFTGLVIPRLTKRTLPLLVKWFSDNWAIVSTFLPYISLTDDKGVSISLARELSDTI
jgi:hypothetical protein